MRKVIAVGATPEEEGILGVFCREKQWLMSAIDRFGRPPTKLPVKKVLNAYRIENNIRATARATGINPGHVYRILKRAGKI